MIPLRDRNPSHRVPIVTLVLIATNVLAFLYELSLGRALERFIFAEALVPRKFWAGLAALDPGTTVLPLVLSMFLHGGFAHIAGNMLYLWVFGDNVEDRMGHLGFFVFYLAAGTAAALGHLVLSPGSRVPMVGASGAIAGVMGAYLVLYPRARVLTLIPMFLVVRIVELPALWFLALWFVVQFFQGTLAITTVVRGEAGGVAWWAHIGGFLAGFAVAWPLRKRRPEPRWS